MKNLKKILILLLITNSSLIISQNLPNNFQDILDYSWRYNFEGNTYVPEKLNNDYVNSYNVLAVKQAQYDRGYNFIKNEMLKLHNLVLINKKNNEYVRNFYKKILPIVVNDVQNLDLSRSDNVNYGYKVITGYLSSGWKIGEENTSNPIVDEIKLLKNINNVFYRLKYGNPDGFYNS